MTKRNKIRYQATPKPRVPITLTGKVYLQFADDEAASTAQKGDVLVYAECEALHTTRYGEYDGTGFSGYFKVDVCDGSQWCALLLNDIFPDGEHHFAKRERPIDTYHLCREILERLAGRTVIRTYREHYELETAV